MVYNTQEDLSLPMLITPSARRHALTFAREQPTQSKQEQVYYNTLAVSVIHDYLQWMSIPTQLEASDSWNPVTRLCGNVADLVLPDLGRLECRPIRENETTCPLPSEVWHDRIGYVIVEISSSQREATILGFSPTPANGELALHQLQPLEDLLEHLSNLQPAISPQVLLGQWLQGVFTTGWQTLETLFNTQQNLTLSFRNTSPESIQRGKLLDLGLQLRGQPLALIIVLTPEENQRVSIRIQLQPAGDIPYLPPNLRLILSSPEGEPLQQVQSRLQDNLIQLPRFRGEMGERFQVQVVLDHATITEEFVI